MLFLIAAIRDYIQVMTWLQQECFPTQLLIPGVNVKLLLLRLCSGPLKGRMRGMAWHVDYTGRKVARISALHPYRVSQAMTSTCMS